MLAGWDDVIKEVQATNSDCMHLSTGNLLPSTTSTGDVSLLSLLKSVTRGYRSMDCIEDGDVDLDRLVALS